MNAVDVSSKKKKPAATQMKTKRIECPLVYVFIYIALYLTIPRTTLLKLVTFTP